MRVFAMILGKIYWRRFRCEVCYRSFELPLDNPTLPPHRPLPAGREGDACRGQWAVPA